MLSDHDLERESLDACCSHIQWLIDSVAVENNKMLVNGWAIFTNGKDIGDATILLNGEAFDDLDYPMPSPDLEKIFWNAPNAGKARFSCSSNVDDSTFKDGFARLEFLQNGDFKKARSSAWYFPDPKSNVPMPDDARITRVIGTPDSMNYLLGGAAIYKRFEHYLEANFSMGFSDFANVLDWGCGSGRVSRYFQGLKGINFWGADIDEDNISWCDQNFSNGKFVTIPLTPATELPSNYFDLVIGISVFTHLDEKSQLLWLEELKRITRPGAILMLSIQGSAQSGLYRIPGNILRMIEQKGFLQTGNNGQLDDVMGENDHYLDVVQSRAYIKKKWGKFFKVVDIVDALAANQDLVVLRRE